MKSLHDRLMELIGSGSGSDIKQITTQGGQPVFQVQPQRGEAFQVIGEGADATFAVPVSTSNQPAYVSRDGIASPELPPSKVTAASAAELSGYASQIRGDIDALLKLNGR